ncbi:hypothetical protein FRC07_010397 [Ceratobasidium sp. 392]|nr:hypothetical protein FRC07_010397 [Ceratobasidium sp. 392]
MPSGPAHRPVTTARTTRVRSGRDERQKRPRPPPHWFTLGSLRSFGERIVHPPPPAVEEDYFMFVSPRFKISFEDVVADKHLPPLSLQDFEDYLQHVDGTPENLSVTYPPPSPSRNLTPHRRYFHLWARHYRRIHRAWAESVLPTIPSSSKGIYRSRDLWERLAHCQDRQLKEEFAFAKATFFDEHAPMRLQISDELRRQVMHVHNMPPQAQELTNKLPSFPQQPEPGHFDAVLAHVDAQLQTAFDKFVFLAFRNSGLWHSCLGHLLGVVILASGMALWCAGIARGKGRPFVAASLPLIWFGVWFMLVSANGHCLAVYSTGDARQLYPHEFARPSQPDDVPPPIYSIARSVDVPCPPPYATSRKASGASATLLPVTNLPHKTYVGKGRRKSDGAAWWKGRWTRERSEVRRMSEGLVKIFGRRERERPCVDEEAASMDDGEPRTEIPLQDLGGALTAGPSDDVPEWERMPFPLPVLEPSDDNEQATPWKVNVGTLKTLPARLTHPPPPPGLPMLKRYTIIPEYDVPLSDILQDKHVSPLSLREFEEYLLYVERGAENLYFCLWLQQYTDEYERQTVGSDARSSSSYRPGSRPRPVPPNESLAQSFQRARELFFDTSSQYELNVTDDMIDPVRHLVRPPKQCAPAKRRKEAWEEDDDENGVEAQETDALVASKDLFATQYACPRDLDKIKCEVEGLLRQSLTRFLQLAFTNAGRSHDKIAYSVWGVYVAAALAASVSLIVGRKPRALRLVVLPLLFIAWSVLFASFNGICTAIYAFGDARQLYPYELYVIRCRARMGNPYARPVDYKKLGDKMLIAKTESVEPIIQPHAVYRPRRPRGMLDKMRWFVPGAVKEEERERDVEQGQQRNGDEGSGENGSIEMPSVSYNGTITSFPAPAYIPTSPHSTLQRCTHIQRPDPQSQPSTSGPSTPQPGNFSITSLSPKAPPIPPNWGEAERRIVRAMDLDLGDPRALGFYGPMVNIPSGFVRRVHREIFVRSMWMASGVTVVIVGVLLVIPVPS